MWIGNKMGALELLTLKSFLNHGCEFHLWLYEEVDVEIPSGIIVEDASEIIPRENIFRYPNDSKIDWKGGKGSCAGFSDIFRYKLLYEKGGWWVDMDVTCLSPLVVYDHYFFRGHAQLSLVGNIMKVPLRSPLMRYCYDRAVAEVDVHNKEWHKPIEILCKGVEKFGLQQNIHYGRGNMDHSTENILYITQNYDLPQAWFYMHWMNSWMSVSKYSASYYVVKESALHRLLEKYDLLGVNLLGANC
jgi:hypothetical protein